MITPKEFNAAKLKKFGEQCRELEKILDAGLFAGKTHISTESKFPDDVIAKVKTRYERAGWYVTVSYNISWTFGIWESMNNEKT